MEKRRNRALAVVWIVALSCSLILRSLIPPYLVPAPHDDGLFVNLGNNIANDNWLGPWNFLTLAKSPGFPIILGLSHFSSIPVTVLIQILYLVGVFVLSLAAWHLFGPWISTVLCVILALNPAMFGTTSSRFYREALIAALVMTSIALLAWVGMRFWRSKIASIATLALLAGFSIGLLAITKTEPVAYVFLAGAGVFSGSLLAARRFRDISTGKRVRTVMVLTVFALGISVPWLSVSFQNLRTYDIAVVDDSSQGPFADLISTWATVDTGVQRSSVVIDKTRRVAVYAVSPSAQTLRDYLEGDKFHLLDACTDARICGPYVAEPNWTSLTWDQISCGNLEICDEASIWFNWKLRDALLVATDGTSREFYELARAINSEISVACAEGRLECSNSLEIRPGGSVLGSVDTWVTPSLEHHFLPVARSATSFDAAETTRVLHEFPDDSDLQIWDVGLGWFSYEPEMSGQGNIRLAGVIDVLRDLYAIGTSLLIIPASVAIGVSILRRVLPGYAIWALGALVATIFNWLVLSFLEANQGSYLPVVQQYLVGSSPLLLLAVTSGTTLLLVLARLFLKRSGPTTRVSR